MRQEGASLPAAKRLESMSQIRSDAEEIVTAVEHIVREPAVPGWEGLFRRIQGGPLLLGSGQDKAREAQVELLVGALMHSTGAEVSFREPDAHAIFRGHPISFAVKRPNSLSNLSKTVKDGRDQLDRAGGTGVLFLDFSQLAPEHSKVETVSSYEQALEVLAPALLETLERLRKHIPRWVQGSGKRATNVLSSIGLVRARFVMPTPNGEDYGTMRRMLASQTTETPVPNWLRDFVDATASIGEEPPYESDGGTAAT
jgi:hypothetical protein